MRVPKLFVSLFLFPLLIGLVISVIQLIVLGVLLLSVASTFSKEEKLSNPAGETFRDFLYGREAELGELRFCVHPDNGPECAIGELDVVVHASSLTSELEQKLRFWFEGATERVHICENCTGNIVIEPEQSTYIRDIWSGVVMLIAIPHNQEMFHAYVENKERFSQGVTLFGDISFNALGIEQPVHVNTFGIGTLLVLNIGFLVVVMLWLGLKAHRRVLDYFVESNALLPLVSACGKQSFYGAIWLLTFTRMCCFLAALIPTTLFTFFTYVDAQELGKIFSGSLWEMLLWFVVLSTSLSLLMIVGSIADLKRKVYVFSFLFRYIPIAIGFAGIALWMLTFLVGHPFARLVQYLMIVLPITGIAPVLFAPILPVRPELLVAHGILSFILVVLLTRRNAQWFAAHLEEV